MATSVESVLASGDGPSDKKGEPRKPRAEIIEIIEEFYSKSPSGKKSSGSATKNQLDLKKVVSFAKNSLPTSKSNVFTKCKSTMNGPRNVPKRRPVIIMRRPADVSDTLVSRCSYGNIMTPSLNRMEFSSKNYPQRHTDEFLCPTHQNDARFFSNTSGFSSDENYSNIAYSSTAMQERQDSDNMYPEHFSRCVVKNTTPRWNSNRVKGKGKRVSDLRLGYRRNSVIFNRPVFTRINMYDMKVGAHDLFKMFYPDGMPRY